MKSAIQNFISSSLSNPLRLLLLITAFTLAGCSGQNEPATDTIQQVVSFKLPDTIQGNKLDEVAGTISATISVNAGTPQPMTIDLVSSTASITLTGVPLGSTDFTLTFSYDDTVGSGVLGVATDTQTINVVAGSNTLNFVIDDFDTASFDNDGDSFSNIAEFVSGTDPLDASLTPVVSRVVFRGDLDTDNVNELYSVDAAGGARIKLSPTLLANGDVGQTLLSPDGRFVAFTVSNAVLDGANEVFVAPVDGSTAAVKVSSIVFPFTVGVNFVSGFSLQWAPDSSRIAWTGDFRVDDAFELFTATPTGSQQVINPPMVLNGDMGQFIWAPDSSRIAYRADQVTDNVQELFTALPAGTGRLKVSGPLVLNGSLSQFKWAPDSSRIAYNADQLTDNVFELFTTDPAVAGAATRVSQTPLFANPDSDIFTFAWAPDSSRIAYTHDRDLDGVNDLFTTVPDSAAQTFKVNNTSLGAPSQSIFFPKWSPDSSLIAYAGDVETDQVFELFIDTPDSARTSPKVSGSLVGSGGIQEFEWSPDGSQLVFTADAAINDIFEVYSVSAADGSARVQLSSSAITTGFVSANLNLFAGPPFTPDGSLVRFDARHDIADTGDLFSATPGVADSATNLSQLPVVTPPPVGGFSNGFVQTVVVSPDGQTAAYDEFTQDSDGITNNFRSDSHTVAVDGSGADVNLTSIPPNTNFIQPFTIGWSAGGERVLLLNDDDPLDLVFRQALFSAKSDGSETIDISGTITVGGTVFFVPLISGELPEIEANDNPAQSQALPFPLTVSGTAAAGNDDFFNFTPPASGVYEFQLSTTAAVSIEILDTDGVTVMPNGSGAKLVSPTLVAGSKYFIKLTGIGDYRFNFRQPPHLQF